ncbi:hypothetical protein EIP86_009651 [Pleurotus ostreatoroseus]|nr:hypothetical protein EIP86_009651 [Pleurotus ostreatoroseus]
MISDDIEGSYLDTLEGEITFFRSIMRARPIGIHRHFHMLVIRNAIHRDTGHWVEVEDLWRKLRECYDMDALEAIDFEIYGNSDNKSSPPVPVRSPSPSDNLAIHPYFKREFTLPTDETYDSLISRRRMRASASLPSSSPAPSPTHREKSAAPIRRTRKGKSRLHKTAGLVAGDSDSSALTQDSGDESVPPTPATGTDGATEYVEEAEQETEQSPEPSLASKHGRKGAKGRRNSTAGRGKATTSTRGTKKRKR